MSRKRDFALEALSAPSGLTHPLNNTLFSPSRLGVNRGLPLHWIGFVSIGAAQPVCSVQEEPQERVQLGNDFQLLYTL